MQRYGAMDAMDAMANGTYGSTALAPDSGQ